LSDIILEENGTIDKFEGDAIIAFWNAPLDQEDHAERACRAALRMVKAENDINRQLIEEGILSQDIVDMLPQKKLFTRIGLHTGPNDVGFIGTDRRKSYTALGDNMNLAARLEGVNKKYNTQVLISSVTEEIVHTQFITRQLDKVRVIGKDDIITLYELTCFKEDFSETQRECFNHYREALKLFRTQEWEKSERLFRIITEKLPGDGPANEFLGRIKEYKNKSLPKTWDGVYTLEFK
jgi:adenylate cyclase